jgi:hypothetical protein
MQLPPQLAFMSQHFCGEAEATVKKASGFSTSYKAKHLL